MRPNKIESREAPAPCLVDSGNFVWEITEHPVVFLRQMLGCDKIGAAVDPVRPLNYIKPVIASPMSSTATRQTI
jgi:hypothetical protein